MHSKFATAMTNETKTWNGAPSLLSPDISGKTRGRIGLFYKSVRGLNIPRLYEFLREAAAESIIDTFILVFHIRDCRGGKGERLLGRKSLIWLFLNYPNEFILVAHLIPEYGRWDDLICLWPKVLDLSNLTTVRNNWSVNIKNENELETIRSHQKIFVNIFIQQLNQDYDNMLKGKPISLCAKWCPTENNSIDRKYNVVDILCKQLNIYNRTYRKKFISPLRSYLNIVEKLMCQNDWDKIDFSKVPSCAMIKLKNAFQKHCPDEFLHWKLLLKSGKTSVNAKQVYPHEIVHKICFSPTDIVLEEQWKVLEKEVGSLGYLSDTLCVCDVSYSMTSWCNTKKYSFTPMEVAIGLSLLISNAVKGPFHNHIITFHSNPQFHIVDNNENLYNRIKNLRNTSWGGTTNLQATFDLILSKAIEHNLSPEDMPKRIFIFSDMQFDNCMEKSLNNHTNYQVINKKYKNSGYKKPEIIFWNIVSSTIDFPVSSHEKNTALLSGFSPNILSAILKNKDFSPYNILRETLDSKRYSSIKQKLI